jgi:hypothetical protein
VITFKKYLLLEGASPLLYHYTALDNAVNIVDSGKMLLTYSLQGRPDRRNDKDKPFYMSFSRTRHGFKRESPFSAVLLEFDGKALNNKYEIRPFDYWGYSWEMQKDSGFSADEQEDRLFSYNPEIPLWKYLRAIHVFFRLEDKISPSEQMAGFIKHKCNENDIPCYVYNDVKAWRLGNKKKAIEIESAEEKPNDPDSLQSRLSRLKDYDTEKMLLVLKFIKNPLDKEIGKEFSKHFSGFDWKSSLVSAMDNIRKKMGEETRGALRDIVQIERKTGKPFYDIVERAMNIKLYYDNLEYKKTVVGWFIKAAQGKFAGGFTKENLGSSMSGYDDDYTLKTYGEDFQNEMIRAKFEAKNKNFKKTLLHLKNAKSALDNIDMEEVISKKFPL